MDRREPDIYRIKIKESLNRSLIKLAGEIGVETLQNGETIFIGAFVDQSALRGFLDQLWNFNLTVLSVELVQDRGPEVGHR